jgi:acyl-CoA thioester hydrolase
MRPPARKLAASQSSDEPGARPKVAFSIPVRVYYQDTDAGGVVFHARYLNFLERARTEWLRHIGYGVAELAQRDGLLFIVREVHMTYSRPAVLEDLLTVTAAIAYLGRAHFALEQLVLRGDEELARGVVDLACITADGFKPARVPLHLRAALETSMGWAVTQEEGA